MSIPTIRELASALGVSRATVSLALRNEQRISASERRRIQEFAAQQGYRKNALVTALMTQVRKQNTKFRGEVVGFLTAYTEEWHWKSLPSIHDAFLGAQEKAEELGFKIEHFWLGPQGRNSKAISRILRSRNVRGMVLAPMPSDIEQLQLDWENFPWAAIGYSFRQQQLHRVAHNQFDCVRGCFTRLKKMGHHRIGLAVPLDFDERVHNYWISGFLGIQALSEIEKVPPLIMPDEFDRDGFRRWMRREKPDSVISLWPDNPLKWLRELGIQVPETVSYTSMDIDYITQGKLSGIHQNHRGVGASVVELMASQIFQNRFGLPETPTVTLIDGWWTDGPTAGQREPSLARRRATRLATPSKTSKEAAGSGTTRRRTASGA